MEHASLEEDETCEVFSKTKSHHHRGNTLLRPVSAYIISEACANSRQGRFTESDEMKTYIIDEKLIS